MHSRHRTTTRLALAGSAVAALALVLPLQAANAAQPKHHADRATTTGANTASEAGSGARASAQSHAASYWTPQRRAAAKPAPLPTPSAAQVQRKLREKGSAQPSALGPKSAPPTAPKGATAHARADETPKDINTAQRWRRAGSQPAVTTGQLFYTKPDGSGLSCTASVIHAANRNTVWTAGHCVHPGGGGAGKFYDPNRMVFVPDNDDNKAPHGLWNVRYVNTTKGWQNDGDFDNDLAAAEVAPQAQHGNIQDFAGSQGYRFNAGQDFSDVTFLGYPAAGNGRSFPGDQLYFCRADTEDASIFPWDERLQMVCDMGQGSSGGPWLDDLKSNGRGYIVGAMSHIQDPDVNDPQNPWSDDHGFSANHGDGAVNVYNDVSHH